MYFLRIRVSFSFILLRLLRSRSDRPSEVLQLPHRNEPVQTPWSILRRWHWPLQSHPYYPEIPWYEQRLHIQRLLLPEQLPDFSVPDGSVPRCLPAEFRSPDPVLAGSEHHISSFYSMYIRSYCCRCFFSKNCFFHVCILHSNILHLHLIITCCVRSSSIGNDFILLFFAQ